MNQNDNFTMWQKFVGMILGMGSIIGILGILGWLAKPWNSIQSLSMFYLKKSEISFSSFVGLFFPRKNFLFWIRRWVSEILCEQNYLSGVSKYITARGCSYILLFPVIRPRLPRPNLSEALCDSPRVSFLPLRQHPFFFNYDCSANTLQNTKDHYVSPLSNPLKGSDNFWKNLSASLRYLKSGRVT